jgi:hypothetical protein
MSTAGRFVRTVAIWAVWLGAAAAPAFGAGPAKAAGDVTFTKDVAPILQRSCQRCHRPDSVAPMSLLTYEEARPWARSMKARTAKRDMPPWFIEKNIGIQQFKDDISLSDDEIATIAAWADGGAPRGNPADMPAAIKWADANAWTIGTPDLIVSSPVFTMPAVGADFHDEFGPVPTGLTEDRYIKAVEVKEVRLLDADTKAKLDEKIRSGSGYGRFTIHHLGIHTGEQYYESEEGRAQFRFTHEIGQNATFYPKDVGVVLPAGSQFRFTTHLFAAGEPVKVRADVGFILHPKGWKPKYQNWEFGSIGGGALIDIPGGEDNVRLDGFYIMPKDGLLNTFEPHMHASGRRMCLEAIYPNVEGGARGRNRTEVLSCAKYDHNWAKVYVYEDDAAPLLPKGTVLHLTGWYDNTSKNRNVVDPRNWKGHGERSVDDMFISLSKFTFLTEEQYKEVAAARAAKRQTKATNQQN